LAEIQDPIAVLEVICTHEFIGTPRCAYYYVTGPREGELPFLHHIALLSTTATTISHVKNLATRKVFLLNLKFKLIYNLKEFV